MIDIMEKFYFSSDIKEFEYVIQEGGVSDLSNEIINLYTDTENLYLRHGIRSAILKKECESELGLSSEFETIASVLSYLVK